MTDTKKAAALKEVRERLTRAFATEDGLFALRYLSVICGQNETSIVVNKDSEVVESSMLVNEARRSVYLDLRKIIRADIIKKAELKQYKERRS